MLTRLAPLHEHPATVEAIAGVIAASAGTVCAVCGLERMGHGVESSWLGIPAHDYAPRVASAADRDPHPSSIRGAV